jgi:hypothetical protein
VLDLAKLSDQIEDVQHHLESAEASLVAAASADPAAASEVDGALEDIRAACREVQALQHAISQEFGSLPAKVRCGHCQTEMLATASRCRNCWRQTAKA